MQQTSIAPAHRAELEASVLGVLLVADSLRSGGTALLEALQPVLEDATVAITVRDRDGLALHVIAEAGEPQRWPAAFDPKVASGAEPAVDPATSTLVVPLRANGRVVGALVFADSARGSELLHEGPLKSLLDATAAVLHALVAQTDGELRRQANSLRSIEAIVEGMAHQIANPLTGASAMAQLLADELEDEGQRAAVQQIRQELTRAFAVLSDLLEFQRDTRAQDGQIDLNSIVERIARFRGYAIREQGIALDLALAPGYLPVRADSRGLEHALLVAMRFAELQSHGTVNRRINVRVAERDASTVAVEITDSGPGEVPDLTPTFLDTAFRVEHAPRQRQAKPDLGLVHSILRGCGGSLKVSASKADGTTLALLLPIAGAPPTTSQSRTRA